MSDIQKKFQQFSTKRLGQLSRLIQDPQLIQNKLYKQFTNNFLQKLQKTSTDQFNKISNLMKIYQQSKENVQQCFTNKEQTNQQMIELKTYLISQNDIFWNWMKAVYRPAQIDILKKTNLQIRQLVQRFSSNAIQFKEDGSFNLSMCHLFYENYKELAEEICRSNTIGYRNLSQGMILAFMGKIIKNMQIQQNIYLQIIENHPQAVLAYIFLGDTYSQQGQTNDAKRYYCQAKQNCPYKQIAIYKLGVLQMKSQQYQKAIQNFKQAIKINSQEVMFYIKLAQSYFKNNQKTQASKILQQIHQKIKLKKRRNPTQNIPKNIYKYIGNLWFQMGSYKNSISNYKNYRKQNPWEAMLSKSYIIKQQDIQQIKLYFNLAKAYLQCKQLNKAKNFFNILITIFIHNKIVITQFDQTNIQELIEPVKLNLYILQKSQLKQSSKSIYSLNFKEIKYPQSFKTELDENIKTIKKLLIENNLYELQIFLDFLYTQNKKNDQKRLHGNKMHKLFSKLYYFYGQLYYKKQNYIQALNYYRKSMKQNTNIKSYEKITQIYQLLGHKGQVQTWLQSAIDQMPNKHLLIDLQLAKIKFENKEYKYAKKLYKNVIGYDKCKSFIEPYQKLGQIYFISRFYQDSIDISLEGLQVIAQRTANGIQKNSINSFNDQNKIFQLKIIENLSKAYYKLSKFKEARQYGQKYVSITQKKTACIYKILGKTYYQQQDYVKSLNYLKLCWQMQKSQEIAVYMAKIIQNQDHDQDKDQRLINSQTFIQQNLCKYDYSNNLIYKWLQTKCKRIKKTQNNLKPQTLFGFMKTMFEKQIIKLNLDDLLFEQQEKLKKIEDQISVIQSNQIKDQSQGSISHCQSLQQNSNLGYQFDELQEKVSLITFSWGNIQNQPIQTQRTGLLISQQTVLTAKHNLQLKNHPEAICNSCTITIKRKYQNNIYIESYISQPPSHWCQSKDQDVAIIILKEKVKMFKKNIMFISPKDSYNLKCKDELKIVGYSQQDMEHKKTDKLQIIKGSYSGMNNIYCQYFADTRNGLNDSPIIYKQQNGYIYLLGIHLSRQFPSEKCKGLFFSGEIINQINDWLNKILSQYQKNGSQQQQQQIDNYLSSSQKIDSRERLWKEQQQINILFFFKNQNNSYSPLCSIQQFSSSFQHHPISLQQTICLRPPNNSLLQQSHQENTQNILLNISPNQRDNNIHNNIQNHQSSQIQLNESQKL